MVTNIQVRNDPVEHKVVLDIEHGACVVTMSPEYAVKVSSALIGAAARA